LITFKMTCWILIRIKIYLFFIIKKLPLNIKTFDF
jgi:hypothetical protein